MQPLTSLRGHISVFISHSSKDNPEAKHWQRLLKNEGFEVIQYGDDLILGERLSTVANMILGCNVFLLLVSENSVQSRWVQRELGLAVKVQKQNGGFRPIIIPLYSKTLAQRPDSFPVSDFDSQETVHEFPLAEVRGLDTTNAEIDFAALLLLMTPVLLVSRANDFTHEEVFFETKVFSLYEDLFPEIERDSTDDIIRWSLHTDVGTVRTAWLGDRDKITYNLDSRFFILSLARRAIAFAFYTYDYRSKLMYGNYLGVHECWRSGGLAIAFAKSIESNLRKLFPDYRGTILEVEKLDRESVKSAIERLKGVRDISTISKEDRDQIRKLVRISLYQHRGCKFFCSTCTGEPLVCRSPCLDPSLPVDSWDGHEEDYWLMWYDRPDAPLKPTMAGEAWRDAVRCIRIEILAKSLVAEYPRVADQYWTHANAVVDRTLRETQEDEVCLGKYLDRHDRLTKEWYELRIHIPI